MGQLKSSNEVRGIVLILEDLISGTVHKKNNTEVLVNLPWNEIRENIMRIKNKAFEESIRQDEKELREYWNEGYGFVMKKNGEVVGYSLITREDEGLYLMSTAMDLEHQGRGSWNHFIERNSEIFERNWGKRNLRALDKPSNRKSL